MDILKILSSIFLVGFAGISLQSAWKNRMQPNFGFTAVTIVSITIMIIQSIWK